MSTFPNRERKAAAPTVPAEIARTHAKTHEVAHTAVEFQPESGALAPCDPTDEEQLDHDRREDL